MTGMIKRRSIWAALLLLAACRGNDPVLPPAPETTVTLRLGASMENLSSRAAIDEEGYLTWQTGDKIAILLDDGSVSSLSLESGEGTASATFSGEIPAGRSFAGKAAYPWWDGAWSSSAGELVLTLPESMAWPGDSYVPAIMKATGTSSLSFTHVGAIMQFTIKGMPASVASFRFSTSAGAVMGRNDFTYTFTPSAGNRVFHVPVLSGTLPSYSISLLDSFGGEILSKTKSNTTSVSRCDYRKLTPLEVEVNDKFRVLYYNVLDGMDRDSGDNYDNFVAWVRSWAPDVLVLCEAGDLDGIASRWGHAYTAKVSKDAYPIVITSSHSLTVNQTLTTGLVHGAIHVSVAGYNIVGLHLRPTLDDDSSGNLSADEYAKYGGYRKTELEYIVAQTLDNPSYSATTNWIVCGDFNAYSPLEKTAVSPFGGKSAYAYPEPTASVCYEVYPVIADKLKDVIYYYGGTAYKPSMYHGRSRLDYIFADAGLYSRVGAADVILGGFPGNYRNDNANPSDHMPLYMDLVTYSFKVLDGKTRLEDWPEETIVND